LKRLLPYWAIVSVLFLSVNDAIAQAPSITYSTPQVYTTTVAITPLSPVNTGGAVPATTFGQVTNLLASGTNLANPQAITSDGAGTIYVADYGNNRIRKITSAGVITTLAGSGAPAELDGTGVAAKINGPDGITYDGLGNLYVSDAGGNTIRKIVISTGVVSTVAGIAGTAGHANGASPTTSTFNGPAGLKFDAAGNLYIADQGNNSIRMISGTTVSTLAGGGASGTTSGSANGTGTAATFNGLNDLVADGSGNLYVADYNNSLIRKVVISTKAVTTYAGSSAGYSDNTTGISAQFNHPGGICFDASGNLIVADQYNQMIRMISTTGTAPTGTIAGSGGAAETNGTGTGASFNNPIGVVVDNGNCYVVDFPSTTTGSVRKIVLTGYTISPALPAGLTFNVTTGVITGTPTAVSAATNYTITAYNASGSSSQIVNIACGQTVAWTGGGGTTAWVTGGNWSTGAQPGANDAVTIGVSNYILNFQPSITVADVAVNSITFGSAHTVTLTITSPRTLTINNNLTVNNSASPTITGTGNVNIAPGAIVNVATSVTAGVLTLNLTGKFTLKSNATGSASVGQITSASIAGSAVGSINVERYISGGSSTYRGYRLLSSPVFNGTDTHGNNVYSINYLKNSIYLTATTTTGGFDNPAAANPTLYLYRENLTPVNSGFTTGNFRGINAINNAPTYKYTIDIDGPNFYIPAGNGYLCFFRGDRNAPGGTFAAETSTTYVPTSTTLTATGTLNTGTIIFRDWFNATGGTTLSFTSTSPSPSVQGFNLIGNPYASSIDWDQFSSTVSGNAIYGPSVGSSIYILDPVSKNYGVYAAGTPSKTGTHGTTNVIPSGQGFFVISLSNTLSSLTFKETAKVNSQVTGLNLLMGKPVDQIVNDQHLRLEMAKDEINTDDILINFNNNIKNLEYSDNGDAVYKLGSGAVSLASISSDKVNLAISAIPLPKQSESVGLNVNATANGIYSLNMKDVTGIPQLYDIWLMDAYKKDSLDMRHNKTYSFNIYKSDSTSFGSKRFSLVIRQNPAYMYRLLNFTANKVQDAAQVQVVWKTENEEDYTGFTVERSTDGKIFEVISSQQSSAQNTYSLLDKNPVTGLNYYRLKQVDINNTISYSNIIPVQVSKQSNILLKANINVYPNPASSTISLNIKDAANSAVSYNILISNSSGLIIKQVTAAQSSWQSSVADLQPGTYIVKVFNHKDNTFVGDTKFVKL